MLRRHYNILGSSTIFLLIPSSYIVVSNKRDIALNLLSINCAACLVFSLGFWKVYDFGSRWYYYDNLFAKSLLFMLFCFNVNYDSLFAAIIKLGIPLCLYRIGNATKERGYNFLTMFNHLVFRDIIYRNSMLYLNADQALHSCTLRYPVYYICCGIMNALDLNYLESCMFVYGFMITTLWWFNC